MGDPLLDLPTMLAGDPVGETFGLPLDGSPLIDRITRETVPADVFGNVRDGSPDIGAREYGATGPAGAGGAGGTAATGGDPGTAGNAAGGTAVGGDSAGGAAAAADPAEDGGCGCRVGSRTRLPHGLLAAALSGLLLARRRRDPRPSLLGGCQRV